MMQEQQDTFTPALRRRIVAYISEHPGIIERAVVRGLSDAYKDVHPWERRGIESTIGENLSWLTAGGYIRKSVFKYYITGKGEATLRPARDDD